jgi:hypothetical protein
MPQKHKLTSQTTTVDMMIAAVTTVVDLDMTSDPGTMIDHDTMIVLLLVEVMMEEDHLQSTGKFIHSSLTFRRGKSCWEPGD